MLGGEGLDVVRMLFAVVCRKAVFRIRLPAYLHAYQRGGISVPRVY